MCIFSWDVRTRVSVMVQQEMFWVLLEQTDRRWSPLIFTDFSVHHVVLGVFSTERNMLPFRRRQSRSKISLFLRSLNNATFFWGVGAGVNPIIMSDHVSCLWNSGSCLRFMSVKKRIMSSDLSCTHDESSCSTKEYFPDGNILNRSCGIWILCISMLHIFWDPCCNMSSHNI
jgi:hypothetical protein